MRYNSYCPKVSVILPCKGLDQGFTDNIKAILDQDYRSFEVIFVTATADDPAYKPLQEICDNNHSNVPLKLVTSGVVKTRSQKINNQLCALRQVDDDTEVFVFFDSDIRPDKNFLRYLVNPLQLSEIGVSTGFRWYIPVKNNPISFLRPTWNGGGLLFLIDQRFNYAFGGAMSVKKRVFQQASVEREWQGALTDDFPLSLAVKKLGLGIKFVPQCLVTSYEDLSLREVVEFTNRQTTIARIYHPKFWLSVTTANVVANLILMTGLVLSVLSIIQGQLNIPAVLTLGLIPLQLLEVYLVSSIVEIILSDRETNYHLKKKIYYYLMAPVASILIVLNTISSLCTNKIRWRGVRYLIKSSHETLVLD